MFGLMAHHPAARDEMAPPLPPDVVESVDLRAWIAWVVAALPLFAGGTPTMGAMRRTTRGVLAVLAMRHTGGNASHAATMLGTSRKAVRVALKGAGTYPWVGRIATSDAVAIESSDSLQAPTPDDEQGDPS